MKRLVLIMILCASITQASCALTQRTIEIYDMLSTLITVYDPIFFGLQSQRAAPPNKWISIYDYSRLPAAYMNEHENFNTRFGFYLIDESIATYMIIHNDSVFLYKAVEGDVYLPTQMRKDLVKHLLQIRRTDPEAMASETFTNIIDNFYHIIPRYCLPLPKEENLIDYKGFYLYLEGDDSKEIFRNWIDFHDENGTGAR